VNLQGHNGGSPVSLDPPDSTVGRRRSQKGQMDFSIIIPVKNMPDTLDALLCSIRECPTENVSYEIIVADDGSTIDIGPLCAQYGAILHRSETSAGPADARNRGAQIATGDILLFMDSDVLYTCGVMERAKRELDRDPELQAVSFLNQPYDPAAGTIPNYVATIEHYWYMQYFDEGAELALVVGFGPRGGAVRRKAFEAVGGFDVSFSTNAMEDYDFGKRLAARYQVALVKEPLVYHLFPTSFWRVIRNYFVRTALFVPYYIQHNPPFDKVQTTPLEAMLRLVGASVLLFAVMAIVGVPPRMVWSIAAVVCAGGYACGTLRFLVTAKRVSRSIRFTVQVFLIHYSTTLAIVLGGVWGLVLAVVDMVRPPHRE